MFDYQGNSAGFRKEINMYGGKLKQVYTDILGEKLFEDVTRLMSPKLMFTQPRGQTPVQSVMHSLDELFEKADLKFLWQAILSVDLDEALTKELDRRVILGLGYDPTTWAAAPTSSNHKGLAEFTAVAEGRQIYFRSLDNNGLSNLIARWDTYAAPENSLLSRFVKSSQQYSFRKIRSDQVPDLDSILTSGQAVGFVADRDNYYGTMILAPTPDKIELTDQGILVLKDTLRIFTAPFIVLSEEGVENYTAIQLQGSNLPPYLVALIHEFDHFILYCLQKLPLNITASLFYNKALKKSQ